jgi:hypothetical protein
MWHSSHGKTRGVPLGLRDFRHVNGIFLELGYPYGRLHTELLQLVGEVQQLVLFGY